MKNLKKALAIVLALAMVMAMSLTAFAEESTATYNGSITINTISGQKYKLYKLFDATIVSERKEGENGISYTLMSGKTGLGTGGDTWFEIDNGKVIAKSGADVSTAAFRTWAESYGAVTGEEITGDGTAKAWTSLTSGYYFITTTTGTLVTVTSIMPDVTVQDKNTTPNLEKKIASVTDNDGTTAHDVADDGASANGEIGDTVEYEVTLNGYKGAANYVFKDTLSAGLTLGAKSTLTITGTNPAKTLAENTDYTVTTFEENTAAGKIVITFSKSYLDTLTGEGNTPSVITVKYKATVNTNAVTGEAGNANSATLSYGNDPKNLTESTPSTPKVYVAEIDVNKYQGDDKDDADKKLDGVKFVLQNASGQYYKLENGVVTWTTVASGGSIDNYKIATADGGKISFKGLVNGTYTLTETDPLAGYNNIDPVTVKIADDTYTGANLIQVADVKNSTGSELPETGGIGTTIFYMAGAALVFGAGVLLITRRRMEMN